MKTSTQRVLWFKRKYFIIATKQSKLKNSHYSLGFDAWNKDFCIDITDSIRRYSWRSLYIGSKRCSMQLPPVKEYKLFGEFPYADPQEMGIILSGLWSENFKLNELHTIMRQGDGTSFATI